MSTMVLEVAVSQCRPIRSGMGEFRRIHAFLAKFLFAIVLIAATTTASASASDDVPLRKQVEVLMKDLDAKTLAERTRAEKGILDLGPSALRWLPSPEFVDSPSARESIRRIRLQLERQAARESSAPSRILLTGEHSLSEIVRQIRTQTKNQVQLTADLQEASEVPVAVDWNELTFWDCLDDLRERGPWDWKSAPDSAAILIVKSSKLAGKSLAVQRTGPFRVAIDELAIRSVVGEEAQRLIRVKGRISLEPRLRPLFLAIASSDLQAIANDDRRLSAWNPSAKYEFPFGDGGRDVPFQGDYLIPEGLEIKTITLHGKLSCQMAASCERIVFDQTSQTRGALRRRGGVTVRLREVTFAPIEITENQELSAEVGIAVSYDKGGPAFESHRSWIYHNEAYFETKSGIRISFTKFEPTQQSDGAVAVDYHWRKIAPPASQYTFVYEAPSLIVDVPLEVEVHSIPVPK